MTGEDRGTNERTKEGRKEGRKSVRNGGETKNHDERKEE